MDIIHSHSHGGVGRKRAGKKGTFPESKRGKRIKKKSNAKNGGGGGKKAQGGFKEKCKSKQKTTIPRKKKKTSENGGKKKDCQQPGGKSPRPEKLFPRHWESWHTNRGVTHSFRGGEFKERDLEEKRGIEGDIGRSTTPRRFGWG